MEELRERIKNELIPALNLTENHEKKNKSYEIIEECDLYGFSCLVKPEEGETRSILDQFRSDGNWFNPGNIELMLKSYEIDEPYGSFVLKSPDLSEINYLVLKKKQNRYLSNKTVDEGMVLLNHSQVAESIKKFTAALSVDDENSEAYFARANAYVRLRDWVNAQRDLQKALEFNPSCEATSQLLKSVKQFLPEEKSLADSLSLPTPSLGHSDLIRKLQASLNADYNDNSDSISSSSYSSGGEQKKSKKKHKRKRKSKKEKKKHKSKKSKKE